MADTSLVVQRARSANDCADEIVASADPTSTMIMRRPRPINWLIACGALLMAVIVCGTAMMVLHFRDRALISGERELQNIALLLSQNVLREFESLELIQNSVIEQIRPAETATNQGYINQVSGHDVHVMLKERIVGLLHVSGLGLIDSSGTLINSSRTWPVPPSRLSGCGKTAIMTTGGSWLTTLKRLLAVMA
jgi:cell division protein FtsL